MDTYILAPHNAHNFAVLQSALNEYPEIAAEKRVKYVYKRDSSDVVAEDGTLLVPALPNQYIYLCATVPATDPALLEFLAQLTSYELFNIDTQPFETYWL